jgi:hypothetical protein
MKVQVIRLISILILVGTSAFSPIVIGGEAAQVKALDVLTAERQTAQSTERIQFARGATSAVVSGSLSANSTARYVLRALAYQLMDVTLSAPEGASLSVTQADGRSLRAITGSSASGFRGYLQRTGDYILEVRSGNQSITYSVNVFIPQRISFEPGTTSATLSGQLKAHQGRDYILRASKGQLMDIDVSPANSVQLIIYGVDGTVLRSGMGEGSSFRGELPGSQDYIVTIRAGSQDVTYSMNVIIPRRISFQRGAISGAEYGRVGANNSQYYVLKAMKNQTMQVDVTPGDNLQLVIYGSDGTVLKSGMGEGTNFKGVLPSTQDYIVVLRAGSNQARFKLAVTIW